MNYPRLVPSILLALACTPALAAPPAGFEARVETLRQRVGTPGLAITLTVVALALVGTSIEDRLNPNLKESR